MSSLGVVEGTAAIGAARGATASHEAGGDAVDHVLVRRLRARFDVGLSTIVGGSEPAIRSLVDRAVFENRFDPDGTDLVVPVERLVRPDSGLGIVAGAFAAWRGTCEASDEATLIGQLIDLGPDHVVVWLPAADRLPTPVVVELAALTRATPANLHVVLGGSSLPSGLDPDLVIDLGQRSDTTPGARLWARLGGKERALLARLAPFDELTPSFVDTIADDEGVDPEGRWRHAEILGDRARPRLGAEIRRMARRDGDDPANLRRDTELLIGHLERAGAWVAAAELHAGADDTASAERCLRRFVLDTDRPTRADVLRARRLDRMCSPALVAVLSGIGAWLDGDVGDTVALDHAADVADDELRPTARRHRSRHRRLRELETACDDDSPIDVWLGGRLSPHRASARADELARDRFGSATPDDHFDATVVAAVASVAEGRLALARSYQLASRRLAVRLPGASTAAVLDALASWIAIESGEAERAGIALDRIAASTTEADVGPARAVRLVSGIAHALGHPVAGAVDDPRPSVGWEATEEDPTWPLGLRALLPPALLTELALTTSDDPAVAAAFIRTVPGHRHHLRRLGRSDGDPERAERLAGVLRNDPSLGEEPVEIRTLGGLRVDGRRVTRVRVAELFDALLHHPRATRDDIATRLWPDLDLDARRNNLRVTLSAARSDLDVDRLLEPSPTHLTLDRRRVRVDLDSLDEVLHRARLAERTERPADAPADLEAAVALDDGPYLLGLDTDLIGDRRDAVTARVAEAWRRLGRRQLLCGEPEQAAGAAVRALRHTPLDEAAHELLARSLAAAGDIEGARTAWRASVASLAEQGVAPSIDLVQTMRRVLEAR